MNEKKIGWNEQSRFYRMIHEICREEGISMQQAAGGWAFRFEKAGNSGSLYGYHFGLNSAAASEICNSKSAAAEFLSKAGIRCVPHYPVLPPENRRFVTDALTEENAAQMLREQGSLVVKNDTGTGGTEVTLVRTEEELARTADKLFAAGKTMTCSPFVSIRREVRVVVLDGEVFLMFSKERERIVGNGKDTLQALLAKEPAAQSGLPDGLPDRAGKVHGLSEVIPEGMVLYRNWKHNLGQGAKPALLTRGADPQRWEMLSSLAVSAAKALGIRFASVDVIEEEETGAWMVLEVNSGVMLEHFSGCSPEYYEIAKALYKRAIRLSVGG